LIFLHPRAVSKTGQACRSRTAMRRLLELFAFLSFIAFVSSFVSWPPRDSVSHSVRASVVVVGAERGAKREISSQAPRNGPGKAKARQRKQRPEMHPQVRWRRAYIEYRRAMHEGGCIKIPDDDPATQRKDERLNEMWREEMRKGFIKPIGQYVKESPARADARRRIHYVTGHWYARPLRATAIYDLSELLLIREASLRHVMRVEPTAYGLRSLVRRATTRLVQEHVPTRLVRCLARQLEVRRKGRNVDKIMLLTHSRLPVPALLLGLRAGRGKACHGSGKQRRPGGSGNARQK
jgi:hypothetical protein